MKKMVAVAAILGLAAAQAFATPSTQIWNPSTDIQGTGTLHLGIDNYFSVADNENNPVAFPTDIGLTYGLFKNLEVGIDFFEPAADPVYFNAKYGLPESESLPAAALGVFSVGTNPDATDYNILYGAVAKTFQPVGRLTLGYYSGNSGLLVDENGEAANSGLIATWDKALTDKIWASVDYASGRSSYGSLSFGGSYALAPNASVILGYVVFNNGQLNVNDTFTVQTDFNF